MCNRRSTSSQHRKHRSLVIIVLYVLQIQILSQETNEPLKAFTRFRETARCGSYRRDGRLLVSGSDDGHIRLFDVQDKSLLRVFKGHKRFFFKRKLQYYKSKNPKRTFYGIQHICLSWLDKCSLPFSYNMNLG